MKILYCPQLPNGAYIKFTIPQRFLVWNLIGWPLAADATTWMRFFDYFYICITFAAFCLLNDAEFRYVHENFNNIGVALGAVPTYLILIETHFRNFYMALNKSSFRAFLKEFYENIYVSRSHNPIIFNKIQRKTLPAVIFTCSYCIALSFFIIVAMLDIKNGERVMLYKMTFPFDHTTTLYRYIPLLAVNVWIGAIVLTMLVGEANMLALTILHLNARYKMLQQDMQAINGNLLNFRKDNNDTILAQRFQKELVKIIKRNADLNDFAKKMEQIFSFRIFVNFANSSLMLCVLGFKIFQTGLAWETLIYLWWLIAKIIESLVIGELGSTLMFTTNKLPSMYYHSNWEQILLYSQNAKANVIAMKTIVLAMELNQNPIYFRGMNFFSVTNTTVLKILQGAFSYFTCLTALNKS